MHKTILKEYKNQLEHARGKMHELKKLIEKSEGRNQELFTESYNYWRSIAFDAFEMVKKGVE